MNVKSTIPVYSLDNFQRGREKSSLFQVEVFDANRHFGVLYPHRHNFYEVLYLEKGSGIHTIEGKRYEIRTPCVFFLSPGQSHELTLSSDIEGYIFIFTSEFYLQNQKNKSRLLEFPFFFSPDGDAPPLLLYDYDNVLFIKSLFSMASNQLIKNENPDTELFCSVLDLILLTCRGMYPSTRMTTGKSKSYILVKRFLLLAEEHFQDNITVEEYARKLGITAHHLTQVVKQATGKTTMEVVQEKAIAEIKRLLKHSTMSVTEVAEVMNFSDNSYFTKFFKKHTGQTPLQYRKQ